MMMGFGLLLVLVVGIGLIAAFAGGRDLLSGHHRADGWSTGGHHKTAREVLDERLAQGEITVDEYETLRTRIQQEGA